MPVTSFPPVIVPPPVAEADALGAVPLAVGVALEAVAALSSV